MPTYEYQCAACSHGFEREQRITEDPIKLCPKCGAKKAQRLITQGNFILKGGGWYSDLYSGPSNSSSAPKGGGSKPSGDDSGSSDTASSATSGTAAVDSPSSSSDPGGGKDKPASKAPKAGKRGKASASA